MTLKNTYTVAPTITRFPIINAISSIRRDSSTSYTGGKIRIA